MPLLLSSDIITFMELVLNLMHLFSHNVLLLGSKYLLSRSKITFYIMRREIKFGLSIYWFSLMLRNKISLMRQYMSITFEVINKPREVEKIYKTPFQLECSCFLMLLLSTKGF